MEFPGLDFNSSKPLTAQIADVIERKIINKEIPIGQKIPPQEELRKIFKVGLVTVKGALSHLSREGYISRRPNRGTVVISAKPSRAVDLRKSGICLVVCDSGSNKKQNLQLDINILLKAIGEKAREKETYLTYTALDGDELYLGAGDAPANIAGLIVSGIITPKSFRIIKKSRIPFVLIGDINQKAKTGGDVDVVCTNDFENAYLPTKHLIELGHRRIAFMIESMEYPFEKDSIEGYRQAHRDAGLKCDDNLVVFTKSGEVSLAYLEVRKFLKTSVTFTAVVDVNSLLSAGVINAFKDKGLRIPEDVSVTGFMDGILDPKMDGKFVPTQVCYDREEMGRLAAQRLFEKLADPDSPPRRIYVPGRLLDNGTTRKLV